MKFNPVNMLSVTLDFGSKRIPIGRLGFKNRQILFEFSPSFLATEYEISPLRLKKRKGVLIGDTSFAGGLPGVFNDSLPDGWGRLLIDRQLRAAGLEPRSLSPLDRLALVGDNGMGALTYEPFQGNPQQTLNHIDLDQLAYEVKDVLQGAADEIVPKLSELNGASQGARPKVMVQVSPDKKQITFGKRTSDKNAEDWMIKFPGQDDPEDAAAIEYAYSQMARQAGVEMMPTHLYSAKKGVGYFGVQRFDRNQGARTHMITASGLLHADHTLPSLDYKDLLRATLMLTRDMREVEKMYRIAVFNVLAHNRDDHAKNFSFLMDLKGKWRVAPAYDLNYAPGPAGEHCTMVMGEGKNPTKETLLALADISDINAKAAKLIIDQVSSSVSDWATHAKSVGMGNKSLKKINDNLLI